VASLPVGEYPILNIDNKIAGLLIIERSSLCFECVTNDASVRVAADNT